MDESLVKDGHTVTSVVVVKRNGEPVEWTEGRDLWWDDVVGTASAEHTAVGHDSEHPLFILYTSGTTGKPKGILHTTGGYLAQTAFTHLNTFDLKPETDVYWCTADIGWVTGHSYVTYAPLVNGATQLIYEGTPDTPHQGRWWELVEKYKVSILYTAPTAIRTCMKWGRGHPGQVRPGLHPGARLGGRAHQPRGLDVVPHASSAATAARRRSRPPSWTPGGRPKPART